MSRQTFSVLVALMFLGLSALPASAVGTSGDTGAITNGFFTTGDTFPRSFGRVSISAFATALGDSKYFGPASADTITVDTAYDLRQLYNRTSASGLPGETVQFVYWIENIGNATYRVDFDTVRGLLTGFNDTNWGAEGFDIYGDGNKDSDYGDAGEKSDTTYDLVAPGRSFQIIVVGRIPTTASNNDSSHIVLYVTDNATGNNGSVTGDAWESGGLLPSGQSNDSHDTMWDTVVVMVVGPNVIVSKTVRHLTDTRSRPGDTLVCVITFDNDGDTEAKGVSIYDAIPQFARYQKRSADSGIFRGNEGGSFPFADTDITIAYDTDAAGVDNDFLDSEGNQSDTNNVVKQVRWTLVGSLAVNDADAVGTVEFQDAAPNNDNGRVAYRVVIE